jgi:hypothetical protein
MCLVGRNKLDRELVLVVVLECVFDVEDEGGRTDGLATSWVAGEARARRSGLTNS